MKWWLWEKKNAFFECQSLSRAVLCSALLTSLLTYLLTYLLATCLPAWLRLTKLLTYYLNYCVLFVSPSLTWRDVQHIIVRSARHAPEGNPLTGGFWVKNKAGLSVSGHFGFGLMDGGMMVHLAKQWNTVPSQLRCEIKGRDENRFGLSFILLVVVADYQ